MSRVRRQTRSRGEGTSRPIVVLIAGTYGSGKSTLAENVHGLARSRGVRSAIVDYDLLIGNSRGDQVSARGADDRRKRAWNELFLPAIQEAAAAGNDIVLVPGTFSTRERRDRFVRGLDGHARVLPLYLMVSMGQTTADIRASRTDGTHLVNDQRYVEFYRTANRAFMGDDHTDKLLPSDRGLLPREYRSMLRRHDGSREVVDTPELDYQRDHRWVVIPGRPDAGQLLDLLRRGVTDPYEVRRELALDGEIRGEADRFISGVLNEPRDPGKGRRK